ncbi:hypothetical protein H7F51_15205 [Novosphingobium flavum]|uniref:Uncharacterized protein n=1 Tax=Novosphingobium flavum TaxID=1778672 RepID=A0A7X1FTU0_9SPHN|nr:TorF family putative porin [Novosphingobium flavum]MBC2666865.1 hypothetical protein [Novosphingobium flavum]
MRKIIKTALASTAFAAAFAAAPAFADETPAVTVTGSAAVVTEYSLRGISQSNLDPAVQAGLTLSTAPGFYVGTWASSLAGNGTWGGSNMELDLIAGYTKAVGAATLDGGVVYYVYPGTTHHDYVEVYGSVSGKVGPVNAKLGTYWAPPQKNLTGFGPSKGNNIWVYTDLGLPIPNTPLTLKGHVGYSSGDSIYTLGQDVIDYGIGADITFSKLTLNVSYVGTDMNKTFADAYYSNLGPAFGYEPGHKLTRGRVVASLTAAF